MSDLGLPEVDGFEFIRHIRDIERSTNAKEIPAMALSAFAGAEVRRKAIDAGFQLCLTKPSQALLLVQHLKRLLRKGMQPD